MTSLRAVVIFLRSHTLILNLKNHSAPIRNVAGIIFVFVVNFLGHMIFFSFGIVIGLLLAILVVLVSVYVLLKQKKAIERKINQVESVLKPKGSILEPQLEELETWINNLK